MTTVVIEGGETAENVETPAAEVAEAVAEVAEAVAEAVAEPNPEPSAIVDVDLIAEAVASQLTEAAELEKEQNEFKAWQENITSQLSWLNSRIEDVFGLLFDIKEKLTVPVPVEELENNPVAAVEVIPEPVAKVEEPETVAAKSRKWF